MTWSGDRPVKVVVGISGGVDSAVAAALLLDRGFEVIGVHLRIHSSPEVRKRVERIVAALGIDCRSLEVGGLFRRKVLLPFFDDHRKGLTPNPCVICNEEVKFASLLSTARRMGAEMIATGHYARIHMGPGGPALGRCFDRYKDQSYMLYRLRPQSLVNILFPLGGMTKGAVRELGERRFPGLFQGVAESNDICFIPRGELADAVERAAGPFPSGRVVNLNGVVLGIHKGLNRFTVGQRKGHSLPGGPWFVVEKRVKENELVVGRKQDLVVGRVTCGDPVWHGEPASGLILEGCTRYRGRPSPCIIECADARGFTCRFPEGVSGVAPGQSLVLYYNDRVFGGGIIKTAEKGGPSGHEEHR
ncbi:MAG TPA: tRNA 2-thiouridine(34) synthase MnmA [Thermovirgaceae bacterium]|nr:tRNA 2-thiouridine(34) synthase MnmA [Thermovirgaceae bacterium]HRU90936.1 tRNA 2-thiouridine(34) synthase MnmA [Thermovirgaceae bacterium]